MFWLMWPAMVAVAVGGLALMLSGEPLLMVAGVALMLVPGGAIMWAFRGPDYTRRPGGPWEDPGM